MRLVLVASDDGIPEPIAGSVRTREVLGEMEPPVAPPCDGDGTSPQSCDLVQRLTHLASVPEPPSHGPVRGRHSPGLRPAGAPHPAQARAPVRPRAAAKEGHGVGGRAFPAGGTRAGPAQESLRPGAPAPPSSLPPPRP